MCVDVSVCVCVCKSEGPIIRLPNKANVNSKECAIGLKQTKKTAFLLHASSYLYTIVNETERI